MFKDFSQPAFVPRTSQLLFEAAKQKNLAPKWFTDYGTFYCQYHGKNYYFYQSFNQFNSQLGSWFTKDKFATRQLLAINNLEQLNIPYFFSQDLLALKKFFNLYQPLIAKPVLGEKAHGVFLVKDQAELKKFDLTNTLFEQFIIGDEYRCLLLNNQLIGLQKKVLTPKENQPWKKKFINLPLHSQPDLENLALQINQLIKQKLIAIDFIVTPTKQIFFLEANSNPGLHKFHYPDEGKKQLVADKILELILSH